MGGSSWAGQYGAWSQEENWGTSGAPDVGGSALIGAPGTYTVVLDRSEGVAGLALAGSGVTLLVAANASAAPSLTVTAGMTLDGARLCFAGSAAARTGFMGQRYCVVTPVALTLSGGLTGSGGQIAASRANLAFQGGQTLDGVTLILGDNVAFSATGTLTLGPDLLLRQTGSLDTIDASIANAGHLVLQGAGAVQIGHGGAVDLSNSGRIDLLSGQAIVTAGQFANSGVIEVDGLLALTAARYVNTGEIDIGAGGTLALTTATSLAGLGRIENHGGALQLGGVLELAGGTIDGAPGGAFTDLRLSGTVRGGVIRPDGGSIQVAGGTFDAMTFDGRLELGALGGSLSVMNGLSVTRGTIALDGPGQRLTLLDSETLDGIVLELGAGGGDDAIAGPAAGALQFGAAAEIRQSGGSVDLAARVLANAGRIGVQAGAMAVHATLFSNAGSIAVGSGAGLRLQADALVNSGRIDIAGGGTLVLQGPGIPFDPAPPGFDNQGLIEIAAGGTLALDLHETLGALGRIGGAHGTLAVNAGTLDLQGGTLNLGEGGAFDRMLLGGLLENGTVRLAGGALDMLPGGGLSNIVEIACFCAGDRVRTEQGDVPVERLAVGDRVVTEGGATRPVVWIGERRLDCARHARPELVWPVRIRAGAFGPGRPQADLRLSPDHAVCIHTGAGRILVPVKYLINSATIVQERPEAIHYFHVELDRHDVLLANGLPVESYLDTGNRGAFANGGAAMALHPHFAPLSWTEHACAPLVLDGPAVAAERTRLRARLPDLGWRVTAGPAPMCRAEGRLLRPAAIHGRLHRFLLPAGDGTVEIVSGAAFPADIDPAATDRRRLGVRLGAVLVGGRALPLDGAAFGRGLHPLEAGGGLSWRWTDGAAVLRLSDRPAPEMLELLVLDTQPVWENARDLARPAAA